MQVGKRMKINDDWRIGCIFCATMEFVDYGRIWCPTSVSSWRCTTLIVLWHIERLLRYDVSYVETLQNVCYDVILYNVGCAVTSPTYVTSWRRQRSLHHDVANVRYIVTSPTFVTSWHRLCSLHRDVTSIDAFQSYVKLWRQTFGQTWRRRECSVSIDNKAQKTS